jgi:uncharacterized protein
MQHYYYRLNPPRPTFAQDMDDMEKALMAEHAQFWRRHISEKTALLFGPVFDPNAVFGLAIVRAETSDAATHLVSQDPALTAKRGFTFEVYPMMLTSIENL